MDIVVSPIQIAINAQKGAPQPQLQAGQVLEAKVQELLNGGLVRLAFADTTIDVASRLALTPGATVRLAVEADAQGVRLLLLGAQSTSGPAPAAAGTPGAAPAQPPTAVPLTPQQAAAIAASLTRTAAVPGSAPAPAGSQTAGQAQVQAQAPIATGTPSQPVGNAALPATPAQALATAVSQAVVRQNSLAPLFANAAALAGTPGVPPAVQQAAAELLRLRLPLDGRITAADLQQAAARSGTFLEARLAAATATAPNAAALTAAADAPDLKAALALFRHVVKGWLDAQPEGQAATARNAAVPNSSPAPIAMTASVPGARVTPPPPWAGAAPVAQGPVAPSIVPDMPAHDLAARVLADADAGAARQTLLQAASLPDRLDPAVDRSGPRWQFEIPLATPQGTAIAQFEVSRDGGGAGVRDSERLWRIRFAIDVEPMGPVHAQISYRISTADGGAASGRTAVTLWAERPETAARLRADSSRLSEALRAEDLAPGDILVRGGEPPAAATRPRAGTFLDRAS